MKSCRATLIAVAVSALLAGCATTDNELSQKEKDKIARDMEKANRKEAQSQSQNQSKMMRDSGQRSRSR